jgi:hypothetical protein
VAALMADVNEVKDADCEAFDGYVAKWQKLLGLLDWRIERSTRRSKKSMAEVTFDDSARLASYRIGLSFGAATVTPDSLERTALHEVLHVLLHDLLSNPDDATEHRVINVLEKILMGAQE